VINIYHNIFLTLSWNIFLVYEFELILNDIDDFISNYIIIVCVWLLKCKKIYIMEKSFCD